jgi:hypothetical protein
VCQLAGPILYGVQVVSLSGAVELVIWHIDRVCSTHALFLKYRILHFAFDQLKTKTGLMY